MRDTPFITDELTHAANILIRAMSNEGREHKWYEKWVCKIVGHTEFEKFNHYPDLEKEEYDIWLRCPRCGLK